MQKTLNKILYVEDDPDISAIAQVALEELGGFTVKYCTNGLEALEVVQVFAPDMIVLDVMMPKMDGPTTLKNILKIPALAGIPVVFMTAKVQKDEIETYKQLGAVDVIVKPFDPMTLADRLVNLWRLTYDKQYT